MLIWGFRAKALHGVHYQKQGIHGLIGRDVLQHMLLVYNGYSGDFTLAV
jgi:hypothetical protein